MFLRKAISFFRGKKFQSVQTVNNEKNSFNNTRSCNFHNTSSTFVSPIYTFSLAGNIIVYTPIRGTNREKYFNHNIYKGQMPTLVRNKQVSNHFLFHRSRPFHLSTEKGTGPIRQKRTSKWLFPRRHNKYYHKQKMNKVSHKKKILQMHQKMKKKYMK